MNSVENNIVHLLTGKDRLNDVSVDELQTITREHPYFSVAQLLLTKKMKQDNHPDFLNQLHKTALYFPNTNWLHYQLSAEENTDSDLNGSAVTEQQHIHSEDDIIVLKPEDAEDKIKEEDFLEDDDDDDFTDESNVSQNDESIDEPEASTLTEEIDGFENDDEEMNSASFGTEDVILSSEEIEKNNLLEEGLLAETFEQEPEVKSSETPEINFQPASEQEATENEDISSTTDEESNITYDALQQPFEIPLIHSAEAEEESKEEPETPILDEEEIAANADQTQPVSNRLSEMLEEQAAALKKPVEEDAKLPIETEPYHTIDYFESQGIRLETQPQDKLGTKVRKFTDWLKQMKRINPQPADLGTDPEMEHVVKDIAESSNEAREIVTEAMAEVLKKQGKTEKAIQLYTKLSFLNPDKSAYFAAKIQELKGI